MFTGLQYGIGVDITSRQKLLAMIKRESRQLAGELFDPALLDLQHSIKKYCKNFSRLSKNAIFFHSIDNFFVKKRRL